MCQQFYDVVNFYSRKAFFSDSFFKKYSWILTFNFMVIRINTNIKGYFDFGSQNRSIPKKL